MVPAERFAGVAIDEEAVAKRYEEQRSAFMSPEEVKLRYVVLSRDDLAAEIDVPGGTLESWYEARKAAYTAPEQRRVRHILIAGEEGGDEALSRAEELRSRILAGEGFEDLAAGVLRRPGLGGVGRRSRLRAGAGSGPPPSSRRRSLSVSES